jgi:glycerate-2-kinase
LIIKNTSQLLPSDLDASILNLRKLGLKALEKAIEAVKPEKLVKNSIRIQANKLLIEKDLFNLDEHKNIFIIGGGKATAEMAFTLENIFEDASFFNYEGIINIPKGIDLHNSKLPQKIRINRANHPIPNEMGILGTTKMLDIVEHASKKDLIICLISGGGSALLPLPKKPILLEELQEVNSLLLASGASIQEINAVRKHLSDFKGGNLAKKIYVSSGATLISLIISDVVGDDLDSIASGPSVPDTTTFEHAVEVLKKYDIYDALSPSVKEILQKGIKNKSFENPKSNDPCFNNVHNYIIGSVKSAINEIKKYLSSDFETKYFNDKIIGEAQKFGKELYHIISDYLEKTKTTRKYIALIGSGELTVTIKGDGVGGRNQEALLSFLDHAKYKKFKNHFLILASNLDGIEGNSRAMGALVDNHVLSQLKDLKLDTKKYLNNNDSNSFFKNLNSELITGPTGCNVNDIILILILRNS